MKNRKYLFLLLVLGIGTFVLIQVLLAISNSFQQSLSATSIPIKPVQSQISADGSIHSESETTLHFQVGGKLTYLPFKLGDSVYQGQTIAALDSRSIEKNIQSAVDSYKNQKISFDIVNDFNGDRTLADTGLSVSATRQLESSINTLDQTQLAVEIQQLAKEQATLNSPLTGIITGEDVTVPNVNISTATSFSVADPSSPVFQAYVLPQEIDFVQVGANVQITIDGLPGVKINGSVERIYPQKTTLSDGSQGYQVDITSPQLKTVVKLGQTGHALIQSVARQDAMLVPVWAVVGHEFIWIDQNGSPILKKVIVGNTHGNEIEISGFATPDQKIILNPQSIAAKKYKLL